MQSFPLLDPFLPFASIACMLAYLYFSSSVRSPFAARTFKPCIADARSCAARFAVVREFGALAAEFPEGKAAWSFDMLIKRLLGVEVVTEEIGDFGAVERLVFCGRNAARGPDFAIEEARLELLAFAEEDGDADIAPHL